MRDYTHRLIYIKSISWIAFKFRSELLARFYTSVFWLFQSWINTSIDFVASDKVEVNKSLTHKLCPLIINTHWCRSQLPLLRYRSLRIAFRSYVARCTRWVSVIFCMICDWIDIVCNVGRLESTIERIMRHCLYVVILAHLLARGDSYSLSLHGRNSVWLLRKWNVLW